MHATKSRWNRPVVWVIGSLLLAAVGCIAIPLGDPEKSKIDDKLVGIWMGKAEDDGGQTMFTTTAYDNRTYLVSEFDFKKANDSITIGSRVDWKVWLTEVGGQRFATAEIIDPKLLVDTDSADSKEKYAIMKLALSGDNLTMKAVNDDFVKSSGVKNAQELQDLIAKNLDNPKLFGDEDMVLTRQTGDQTSLAKDVLNAFEGK
jgi:hypothetical protein